MSEKIKQKQQDLEQVDIVHLFELDLTRLGDEILRWCSSAEEEQSVFFGGHEYVPRPVAVTGIGYTTEGPSAQPKVMISNADQAVGPLLQQYEDLVGMPFRRIRTYREYLDGEPGADPSAHFPIDEYRVEQKTAQNSIFVELVLSAPFDQEDTYLPGRQVLQSACPFLYRRYDAVLGDFDYSNAECPYAGDSYFDATDQITTIDKDQCSKQLGACRARYGNEPLPFGGFPGVARVK